MPAETPQDAAARAAREIRESCYDKDAEGNNIWTTQWERYDAAFDGMKRVILLARLHERMVGAEKGHAARCLCVPTGMLDATYEPLQQQIDPRCQSLRDAAKREFEEAAHAESEK